MHDSRAVRVDIDRDKVLSDPETSEVSAIDNYCAARAEEVEVTEHGSATNDVAGAQSGDPVGVLERDFDGVAVECFNRHRLCSIDAQSRSNLRCCRLVGRSERNADLKSSALSSSEKSNPSAPPWCIRR